MSTSADLPRALQASLSQARANKIPLAHHEAPDGIVSSPDNAFIHINDWAFLNGHAYVKISGSMREGRFRFGCIFHSRKEGQRTRNYRRLNEKDRQRVKSYVRGIGCPVKITISKQKSLGDQWCLRHTNLGQHNHPPTLNPFSLQPHISRRPALQRQSLLQKHTEEYLRIRNRKRY